MASSVLLISFASWEDRFKLGFERNMAKMPFRKALVYYFSNYEDRTRTHRLEVKKVCERECTEYIPVVLDINKPAENWRSVLETFERSIEKCDTVYIDISTMPREITWYILWMIEQHSLVAKYVYYSPREYGDNWLSRNPRSPRLVYKLSGIAWPLAKTGLLVTVGFDSSRAERLISRYEPAKLLIGVQTSSHFSRNKREMSVYQDKIEEYNKKYDCEIFELDAFDEDRGMGKIEEALKPLVKSFNILMGSLGPKLTAISLYRLQRQWDNIGLVYAPSNQFNERYSIGIGKCFEGTI